MAVDKRRVDVGGVVMAYLELGEGDPIVFLHGNPTSSYLWRKVHPALHHLGRCIVPDLVGMGDSGKLPGGDEAYGFLGQAAYLERLLDEAKATDGVILVGHDWGGALAFNWARCHPEMVRGIAYMETLVCPVEWDDWPEGARSIFQAMRSPAGEQICLEKNVFVERILPASVLDPLPPEVMAEYRRPFALPGEDRRPTLAWPRQLPIGGEPPEVVEAVEAYGRWIAGSAVPKLFVNADPGSILVGRQRELCRTWPNQTEKTVRGSHFIQEDSGEEIGAAVAAWVAAI